MFYQSSTYKDSSYHSNRCLKGLYLGNVLTVINDIKIPKDNSGDGQVDAYEVGIVNVADYSPFGVQLDGRTISNGDYRYGFQGQEKDDEVKGEGNSINYKYRMHDPRIGRFACIDPLSREYPFWSPYAFSGNQVISTVELEGLEAEENLNENEVLNIEGVTVFAMPYLQGVSGDGIGGTHYNLVGSAFSSRWQAASFAQAVGGESDGAIKPTVTISNDSELGDKIASSVESLGIKFSDLSKRSQKKLSTVKWGRSGWFSRGKSDRSDLFFYKKSSVKYSRIFAIRSLPISVPVAVIGPGGIGAQKGQAEVIVDVNVLGQSIVDEFAKTSKGGRAIKRAKKAGEKSSADSEYKKKNPHRSRKNGKGRKNKHQNGEATVKKNQGGEKGDTRRTRNK